MKTYSRAKTTAVFLSLLLVMTTMAGCRCAIQKIRFSPTADKNEEAVMHISINEEGKFIFTDKDGHPSQNTISFDQFVTRTDHMSSAVQGEQQAAATGKWSGKDYSEGSGFRKIQTIEVYRRDGSVDMTLCMDNVCQCYRYNNKNKYCCPCNCNCPDK